MKKIIILATIALAILTSTTQAQSFDETVKYLNAKFSISDESVAVNEYGLVTFTYPSGSTYKYDLNEVKMEYILTSNGKNQFMVTCDNCVASDYHGTGEDTNVDGDFYFTLPTKKDVESTIKAFNHLKTLLKDDPFD